MSFTAKVVGNPRMICLCDQALLLRFSDSGPIATDKSI